MNTQLGDDAPVDLLPPGSIRKLLGVPPGWPFHLMCAVPAAALLWAATTPGMTLWLPGAVGGTLLLAVLWVVRLIAHAWVKGHDRRRFLIAPAGGALVVALIALNVPLQARWAFAHDAFDRVIESLPAQSTDAQLAVDNPDRKPPRIDAPARIGGYRISAVEPVAGGFLFHSPASCGFTDDAGFGWFPEGPNPDDLVNRGFEDPEFSHIWGPWYTWCASW